MLEWCVGIFLPLGYLCAAFYIHFVLFSICLFSFFVIQNKNIESLWEKMVCVFVCVYFREILFSKLKAIIKCAEKTCDA